MVNSTCQEGDKQGGTSIGSKTVSLGYEILDIDYVNPCIMSLVMAEGHNTFWGNEELMC